MKNKRKLLCSELLADPRMVSRCSKSDDEIQQYLLRVGFLA